MSIGVDPSAAVAAGGDVVEVANDLVALVLLQVLVGDDGVAGLGAGVDAVEDLRLLVEIVAVGLEMLVPVGKLDDDLHLRIHGSRRARRPGRGRLRPSASGGSRSSSAVPLAAMSESRLVLLKKKSSSMIFVEVASGELGDLLHIVAMLRGRCSRRRRTGPFTAGIAAAA